MPLVDLRRLATLLNFLEKFLKKAPSTLGVQNVRFPKVEQGQQGHHTGNHNYREDIRSKPDRTLGGEGMSKNTQEKHFRQETKGDNNAQHKAPLGIRIKFVPRTLVCSIEADFPRGKEKNSERQNARKYPGRTRHHGETILAQPNDRLAGSPGGLIRAPAYHAIE